MKNYCVDSTIDTFIQGVEVVFQREQYKNIYVEMIKGSGLRGVFDLIDCYQLFETLLEKYRKDEDDDTLYLKLWDDETKDYLLVEVYDEEELKELIISIQIVSCEKVNEE